MVRMRRSSWAVTLGLLFGLAGPASAGLVTYTFSGMGTGDLAGTAFTNSPFLVTISGDTADISRSLIDPDTPVLVNLSDTFSPAGDQFAEVLSGVTYGITNVSVASVPEPSSVTLLLAGGLTILGIARRRTAGG
jgi:PEP-CTERM motif